LTWWWRWLTIRASTSCKSESITQHDSKETTSGDDGEKTKKEKSKVRMDDGGSDKMAKDCKKREMMGEKGNDMKEQIMMNQDGKGKYQRKGQEENNRERLGDGS